MLDDETSGIRGMETEERGTGKQRRKRQKKKEERKSERGREGRDTPTMYTLVSLSLSLSLSCRWESDDTSAPAMHTVQRASCD